MILRLKRCSLLINRSMDSRKHTVDMPPSMSKLMSTTMLSTKHFSSFTCTALVAQQDTSFLQYRGMLGEILKHNASGARQALGK